MLLSDVCLSVAYIGNNSRTERPRKTKIGKQVAHVTRDSLYKLSTGCAALLVFHGFGGKLAVMDVGPTMMNQIMHYCFKEIHLRRRDLNGKNQFGQ